MRTSQKGGRGGSWGVQASGAAVAVPPIVPPVSRAASGGTTASVGGQILRGLGWFLLAVLVIGAGVAGGLYLYADQSLKQVNGDSNAATAKPKKGLVLPKP